MFGHAIFRRMYQWQVGRFSETPLLYQQFDATPGARPAFFRLNEDLLPTIRSRTKKVSKLREFRRRVRIIFGDADPYLNKGVARRFHELFPGSELFLVPGPRHFLQMDEPAEVAVLYLPGARANSRQTLLYPVRIRRLVYRADERLQCAIVHQHGIGEEIVHLDHLAHERVE
jgi:pimeloyl-ACP methyl ester carboxylesterase